MGRVYDLVIIGGGASGMAAAISCKLNNEEADILILEKLDKLGKKVSVSGNGRCNIANSKEKTFLSVESFLNKCGIFLKETSQGRMYPYNEDGKQVVEIISEKIKSLSIDVANKAHVSNMKIEKGLFEIEAGDRVFTGRNALISTGGKSMPKFGTTGEGFVLARHLGHTVSPLIPALTSIEVEESLDVLAGTRVKAKVSLLKDGKAFAIETGEVQFNKDSISGICIMDLSSHIRKEKNESIAESMKRFQLSLDLVKSIDDVESLIENDYLKSLLKPAVLEDMNLRMREKNSHVDSKLMARLVKDYRFQVKGLMGWDKAQVTSGGVPIFEVNLDTMESKIVKGLYFSGEILDYTGRCGGYNLNHAWYTGIKCGESVANTLRIKD